MELTLAFASVYLIVFGFGYAVSQAIDAGGVHLTTGSVAAQVKDLLWFALLSGFLSYATLELLKRLTRLRGMFQMAATERWLAQRSPDGGEAPPWAAFDELLALMALPSRRERRWLSATFDLPPEQLVAQISAAVDIALCSSERSDLLRALVGHPLRFEPSSAPMTETVGPVDATYEAAVPQLDLADAQMLRAAVDQLQITLGQRWRRQLQAAGVWVSGVYGVILTQAGGVRVESQPRYLFVALLVGGPLSWVIRDLNAALERLRG